MYVDTLIVNSGAELNTGGCRVYYRELTNDGLIPDLGVDVLEIERADFSEDCFVKAADLATLLGNWGVCPSPCEPEGEPGMCPASCTPDVHADTCPADLSDDCAVGAFDLAILLGRWGPVD